jgi:hypothetical protein
LFESKAEIKFAEEVETPQEKLDRAISDEINAEIAPKTRTMKDITGKKGVGKFQY